MTREKSPKLVTGPSRELAIFLGILRFFSLSRYPINGGGRRDRDPPRLGRHDGSSVTVTVAYLHFRTVNSSSFPSLARTLAILYGFSVAYVPISRGHPTDCPLSATLSATVLLLFISLAAKAAAHIFAPWTQIQTRVFSVQKLSADFTRDEICLSPSHYLTVDVLQSSILGGRPYIVNGEDGCKRDFVHLTAFYRTLASLHILLVKPDELEVGGHTKIAEIFLKVMSLKWRGKSSQMDEVGIYVYALAA
ncbi:hypothetical protein B0H10DRAFT_2192485 [Mycena sp. CBHHK59/15]|nr:hypothetical protein B0H10DRAFT_2192485 [Mycena sp. CBHHK59/15]